MINESLTNSTPYLPPPTARGEVRRGVEPQCEYFGTCGGCAYQNLDYPDQLELKRRKVEETLTGLKSFQSQLLKPVIPSPKLYNYRHMIALSVMKRQGILRLGFIGQDRWTFVPIESCSIADEQINQFIPHAYAKLEELPRERRFRTSQVVLRAGDKGDVVTSLRMDRGKEFECTVLGKKFSYSPSSFFQHNFSILDVFVQTIRSILKPVNSSLRGSVLNDAEAIPSYEIASLRAMHVARNDVAGTLFDFYSGVGLFGISLAGFYEKVIGIEESYEAVKHAKQNAERNGVKNIEFLEGKVEEILGKENGARSEAWHRFKQNVGATDRSPLHVIVDPSRKGLKSDVVQTLLKLPIQRLVYVSCELSALRRDLELLEEKFLIEQIQPLDLFPQTKHIETIVSLIPIKS